MPTSISSGISNAATSSRLCWMASPPKSTLSKGAVHESTRPAPTPAVLPAGFMSLSLTPARCAAASDTTVSAPESKTAATRCPFSSMSARSSGLRSRNSCRSSSSATGVSPAQYAMLLCSQSSLGTTKRMTPCARSYSVSVNDSMLRPMSPIAPSPGSLPPTTKSTSGISPLTNFRCDTVARCACTLPARPRTSMP